MLRAMRPAMGYRPRNLLLLLMASAMLSIGCSAEPAPKKSEQDAGTKRQSASQTEAEAATDGRVREDASAGGAGGSNPSPRDAAADSGRRSDADDDAGDERSDAGKDASTARCNVEVAAPTTPTIWLLIDASGSMLNPLNSSSDKSRWNALRDALLDAANGPIKRFEHEVQWGLLLFDGPSPGGGAQPLPDGGVLIFTPAETCPRVVSLPAQLDNHTQIAATYMTLPLGGSTPTDRAFQALLSQLPSDPNALTRTSIVLATDGEPNDFCTSQDPIFTPPDVRPLVIEGVTRAATLKIKTYVISLAGEDPNLMTHLTEVAAAGKTGKAPFVPDDQAALSDAIAEIVGPNPRCEIPLASNIDSAASCQGSVQIDGQAIACDMPDGYSIHASVLRLSGKACDEYKASPTKLSVAFPCDALEAEP